MASEVASAINAYKSAIQNLKDTPGNSELLLLVWSGSQTAALTVTEFEGTLDCTGTIADTISGTSTIVANGEKLVPWDASGVPTGLSDPILATTGVITTTFPIFGTFIDDIVLVIDDSVDPNMIYAKDSDQGGPLDMDGVPDDITLDDALTKL